MLEFLFAFCFCKSFILFLFVTFILSNTDRVGFVSAIHRITVRDGRVQMSGTGTGSDTGSEAGTGSETGVRPHRTANRDQDTGPG